MAPATSTYRVLIVDDNEGIHDDFRTLLQPARDSDALDDLALELFGEPSTPPPPASNVPYYQCDSAFQGRSALDSVKTAVAHGRSYALAFIDIRMPPGWDGIETITKLWAIDPDIHMVLCSAYSDYSWEEIIQRLGSSDKLLILRKPFDPTAIKQLTLATTARWQRERILRARMRELETRLKQCREELARLTEGRNRQ